MNTSRRGRRIALLAAVVVVPFLVVILWVSRTQILFFMDFESLENNRQGYREYRHREAGIVFVRVPGGTFSMGSPEGEEGRQSRELQHEVTVSHFLIAKYEVTQTEWRNVMGNDPSRVTGDTHPVERVSWEDCQEACEKLGLSLPTEAQWEYACRAGTQGTFGGTGKLDDMGWYKANSGGKFHTAVGQKEPNGFGLYDMHGNVWEWCQDSFEKEFYSRSEATKRNPCCTSGSKDRVMRGGFSFEDASFCRSAHRDSQPQGLRSPAIGFRPSRPLP